MKDFGIDSRVPCIQDVDLEDKVVLVRVDHNVVKKGGIQDPYRIDASLGTLFHIISRGGRPILMTHVGRPRDKSGRITADEKSSVAPIVEYLSRKIQAEFVVPEPAIDPEQGIVALDTSINPLINEMLARCVDGIYLPNTRWFAGEEAKDERRERFARQLAGLADVYVNDAFGSWQPHASTVDVTRFLPGCAGFLMQKELAHLGRVMEPKRPFVAVVAGAKFDTKIGPLSALHDKADHLILGGVIYNAYLAAKYGITVAGVGEDDVKAARELVEKDKALGKIVELPVVEESDLPDACVAGKHRSRRTADFKAGDTYGYFLDVAADSFTDAHVAGVLGGAGTIFVNAVMGFTPHFTAGTAALDKAVDGNRSAMKLFGGGDTLQEFRNLLPGMYMDALDNESYYFFTGGGTVLTAIEQGSPYGLPPVKALMENCW